MRLHTFRDGMARKVGHDLILEVTSWNATVEVDGEDITRSTATATIDPRSIVVVEGKGGVKPLSDGDRDDIKKNINEKVLKTGKFPEMTFRSTKVDPQGEGRVTLFGDLTMTGNTRPVRLDVTLEPGPNGQRANAATTIVQSEWGIKPYSGLMGSLKVRDAVELHIEAAVPSA